MEFVRQLHLQKRDDDDAETVAVTALIKRKTSRVVREWDGCRGIVYGRRTCRGTLIWGHSGEAWRLKQHDAKIWGIVAGAYLCTGRSPDIKIRPHLLQHNSHRKSQRSYIKQMKALG